LRLDELDHSLKVEPEIDSNISEITNKIRNDINIRQAIASSEASGKPI
jgi:hypothetical protein